ncbi:MAG: CTP synthase [Candidatus Spechtbacterales bacterium]
MSKKYIFVTGGVMSGVGKGVATSSLGALLKSRGFTVTAVKIDPYINVDAGTMNPTEHGEVFVTKDGMECDQDIGNYERFLNVDLTASNYMTTGLVYQTVIQKERNLEYEGKSVEVVPHIPLEVIRRIEQAAKEAKADITLIEIGGTVGEYQNMLFLEAARMMHLKKPKDVLFILVSYLPTPKMVGEMKTKPTQYAVRTLNSAGIQPDVIVARSEYPLDEPRKQKIAVFCNVEERAIISAPDIESSIYEIPMNFEQEGLGDLVIKKLGLRPRKKDGRKWRALVRTINSPKKEVRIGIVGKYFETGRFVLADSYISVIESVKHAAWSHGLNPRIEWLNVEEYERDRKALKNLREYDGIIVPGGFGSRGVEGKIRVAEYCRRQGIPYLGLCYGLQMAVIEFARNVLGFVGAHTTEVNPKTKHPVIDIMPEQKKNLADNHYGGTMRLGHYACDLAPGSIARAAYGKSQVLERHRHRYEVNDLYRDALEQNGMRISGTNPDTGLVEIIELPGHPFFLATQFHPELQSRPLAPHPLFGAFVKAAKASVHVRQTAAVAAREKT